MGKNNFIYRLKKVLNNPWRVFYHFNYCKISHLLSDESMTKLLFRARVGYPLNLKNPATFNEKLQWLKLYDRKPQYTRMVDKYEVRKYIKEKIGEEYLIPLLGTWNSFEEINFEELPNQFVLKCTHDSGGIVICKDKIQFDVVDAEKRIKEALKDDFYLMGREWPYKDVPRRIIAEKYMDEANGDKLNRGIKDYRIYCFGGEPKLIYAYQSVESVHGEKPEIASCDIFNLNWEIQPFHQKSLNASVLPSAPRNLEKMINISRCLSEETTFLRVDFYEVDEKIYVGELTFYPGGGFLPFYPEEWDYKLGDWIVLPGEGE